jgi:hypothetical protein
LFPYPAFLNSSAERNLRAGKTSEMADSTDFDITYYPWRQQPFSFHFIETYEAPLGHPSGQEPKSPTSSMHFAILTNALQMTLFTHCISLM